MLNTFRGAHVEGQGEMFEDAVTMNEDFKAAIAAFEANPTAATELKMAEAGEALGPYVGILAHVKNMPKGGYK